MKHLPIHTYFKKRLKDECPGISLVDVGVSGGISEFWAPLGDRISGLGIDPLVHSIEHLNELNANPNFRYLAAFVEWPEWDKLFPPEERVRKSTDSFERTSAMRAMGHNVANFHQDSYNGGEALVYADRRVQLDDILQEVPEKRIDFIKTDTDGFDYPVLRSAEKILSGDMVLGLKVECPMHSAPHPLANNFANIDIYMRSKGFTLLTLDLLRYARGAFPLPFQCHLPGQTVRGSHQWGDATYFRDFCNPRFEEITGWRPSRDQLLRMAFILEANHAPDTLAELLMVHQGALDIEADLTMLLDCLVANHVAPKYGRTYPELIANFDADYTRFYPEP